MPFSPEQLIDELYGPPKKEGQKKLEDFKKKKVAKPERPKGAETIITAKDKEGREAVFDLEQIKERWITFYRESNLTEIAEELEKTEASLTEEQIEKLKVKSEEGFDKLILFPSPETLKNNLQRIKEETEKPLPGLPDDQQYSEEGTYLSDTVEPNFPDKIQTNNRPIAKPYFLFCKNNKEVEEETKGKTPAVLREEFSQKGEAGFTLEEYLIFQREYTETQLKSQEPDPHPDKTDWTWLLDSELDQNSSSPGRVLYAYWHPGTRQVEVYSLPSSDSFPGGGARSSAIFEVI